MKKSQSQPTPGPVRRLSLFALRSQLSLSFAWFGSGEQRFVPITYRATLVPGLAWFGGSGLPVADRGKALALNGLTPVVPPRRGTLDAFALQRDGSLASAPRNDVTTGAVAAGGVAGPALPVELVFISPEIAALVPAEELAGARVFVLDTGKDVVAQVGEALQANPGAAVVRVISHGEPGGLMLAGQRVNRDTLQLRSDEIAGWRQHLAPGADILLYGCSVAGSAEGRSFVDSFAALTGADVAASANVTGSASLGGDLTLEYASGPIEALSGRFGPAWEKAGLILPAPAFSSAANATFTNTLPGSFTAAASGSPTYSIADRTFFESTFASLPAGWTLTGAAELSGGSLVLNPSGNNYGGALILPKIGAGSPGSFTASFDYAADPTGGGNGTSFNYGIISPSGFTSNYQTGLVAISPNSGLSVNFIDITSNPRIDVTWGGANVVIASAPITFASTPKPVEIKLDGANLLTVRYDGVEKLRINLAGKVNAADRTNWQFAFGSSTGATVSSRHAIDNLRIASNGALPAGLSLNASTGVISGTPTVANAAGTQAFDLVATNAGGATAQFFSLKLESGAPVFTSAATNPMVPGVEGTFTVVASGTAGPTTLGVGRTLINTTLADATTLPEGAYLTGSAQFNNGALELTQNVSSQTGRLQFVGWGERNPNSFSAYFNYKVGGGSTVGADNLSFFYGGPGTSNFGIYLKIVEFTAVTGTPGNNTNLILSVYNNGNAISVGGAFSTATSTTVSFPNPYLPSASGYNFLPVRISMSDEGRLQVYVNNALAFDAGQVPNWQTIDKSLWAFGLSASTSATNTNFHTVKDLVIATTGVVPAGLKFDTSTGVISGAVGVGTSVDSYVPITATNAAGTVEQSLKIDVSASNLLPGQRPGNGASVGSPSSGTGNAVGVTGEQFRNLTAFAALTADGQIKAWGNSLNGGSSAPTGTGYVSITSNEKAFAALRNDGSISAWGNSANGGTGAPTGTGYQVISSTRSAFAAIRSDGGITVWGNSNAGGLPYTASPAPSGIIYPPTDTGYVRIFANGGGFTAQRPDGTIAFWGSTKSVTLGAAAASQSFGNRIVVNGYAETTPTTSTTNDYGAFAGITKSGGLYTWGSSLTGQATDAPGKYNDTPFTWVDIVATSRAFAAMNSFGAIRSWGDSNFGGAAGGVPLSPPESGYRQIYANNGAFVAVRQDGSLQAWGSSMSGGTGAPSGTGYVQVFSTLNAFAALKADGSIRVWGNSNFGGDPALPPASSVTGYKTIYSTNSAFAALKSDGSIAVWGNSAEGGKSGPTGTGWVEISSNEKSFTARNSNGTLFTWGGAVTAPTGNYVIVQSPTQQQPIFPLAAGAPTEFRITQRPVVQFLPGIRGEGLPFQITSGELPPGLTLDPVSGFLYGAAAKAGTYEFTVSGGAAISRAFKLRVEDGAAPNERQGAGAAYAIGTGRQFPNSGAFVGLGVNGSLFAWGTPLVGGTGAPTGTGYTQVTSNKDAFAALKWDGSISAWGDTRYGGTGAPTATGYVSIVASQQAFAALKSDGTITAWGLTSAGGSGAPTGSGYKQIYAGTASFAALKTSDGTLTVWGDTAYLATGTPVATGFTRITPNRNAYAALRAGGSIAAWGNSAKGGSGAPTATGYAMIYATDGAFAARKLDGSLAVWGDAAAGASGAPSGTGFVELWSTTNAFAALKADGSLVSWGGITNAPTGTGFTKAFSTGGAFAALKADGSIVAWGASARGGTGAPTGTGFSTIFSNNNAFAALKADGSIVAWGTGTSGGTGAPTGTGYTQIFSRPDSFAAMKADGTVISWGGGLEQAPPLPVATVQNATAVLPYREYGLNGNTPGAFNTKSIATMVAGTNGVAGMQVGGLGVGVGSVVSAGSLPPGVSLNVETGFLQGTPSQAGTYTFTVTSYNGGGQTSQDYRLEVKTSTATAAPDWGTTKSRGYATYSIGKAVSYNLAVSAPASGVTYYVVAGALPPGVSLNNATGLVSGTPTVPGTYAFTVVATTPAGTSAQVFTIEVNDGSLPNERIGQGSALAAQTSGRQGLNEAAFAALQPGGTIITWGDSTSGGAGAVGVPTGNGYVQIAQTTRAFAALREDGSIRSWGDTGYGGSGAPTGTGYTRIYASSAAFAATKGDGSIVSWGDTGYGGSGAPTGTGYTQIFTGARAMVAMKADGSLTAWGDSNNGGTGAPAATGFTTITSNTSAFAALTGDGSIAVWGNSANGGGTNAPTGNGYLAVYSTPGGFAALSRDGTLSTWGSTQVGDVAFPGGTTFVDVSSNNGAYAALNTSGRIVAWGASTRGGTGAPTGTGYTALYSNPNAFAALSGDGSIVSWGLNTSGSTGAPTGTGFTRIYSNGTAFVAMKADGTLKSWGDAASGGGNTAPTGTGFTQVFASKQAFVAQKADGSLIAWGASSAGGLGAPTSTKLAVASSLVVPPYYESGVTGDLPTAYVGIPIGPDGGAGVNAYQVGAQGTGTWSRITAGSVPGLTLDPFTGLLTGTPTTAGTYTFTVTSNSSQGTLAQVFTLEVKAVLDVLQPGQRSGDFLNSGGVFQSENSFAALKADGSITAWGDPNFGASAAPTGTGFTRIVSSVGAFAAMKANGSISAWGRSDFGGVGAPTGTGFTKVVAGLAAFAALKADGSIVAWGDPAAGGTGAPTGTGFTQILASFGAFAALKADGSLAAWGDSAAGGAGAPTGTGFTQLFANSNAFVALKTDGSLAAWGDAAKGGTGAPTGTGYTRVFSSNRSFAALKSDGSISTWGDAAWGGAGAPAGNGFSQVFATLGAFAALKFSGTNQYGSLTAWGNSALGGSGAPGGTSFTQVSATRAAFAALKLDGSIAAWGSGYAGGTGAPTGTGFTRVFSNNAAFAALKADGSIAAWGDSNGGGTGAPSGTGFTQVFANMGAFVAMKADGSLTAWGSSDNGSTGAPTGPGFITVQSTRVVTPVFSAFPGDSTLTAGSGQPFFANLAAQGSGLSYEITLGSLPPGLTLDAATGVLSGTPTQNGTFTFTLAASSPTTSVEQTFTLRVPTLVALVTAWPTAAAITYGQSLASAALNGGTASVPGTFAFTSPSTVPTVGTAAQGVTFTPTNSAVNQPESSTVSVTVNRAALTVTADPKSRVAGVANPTLTATITGYVNGDTSSVVSGTPALSTTATLGSPAGSYPITPALGTLAASNYSFSFVDGTLAVGLTAPTLSSVAIASNNPNPAWAKAGDTVTVTFTASEGLATPTATIAGRSATVALVSGNTYTATTTMAAGDTEGAVAFSVAFTALTGAAGTAVTATTDTSAVTYDETAPSLTSVAIASNNTAPTDAQPGDVVTVTFTASEAIQTPTATIAGRTATITNTSGNTYTAAVTMASGDTEGLIPFSISFRDRAGHVGTAVAKTTNGSSVSFSDPAPVVVADGVVTTVAGAVANTSGSVDGAGTAASFSSPSGVAVDAEATVYVADSANHKIRRITSTGDVTTLAGSGSSGSADGTGAAAGFNAPNGVAVGSDGTVYVADSANHKVRKITPAGVVTTLAGSGSSGSADGTGAAAGFNTPNGLAVASDGTVYVADSANHKVRKITAAGVVTTLAGSGSSGSADGTGAAASFNAPFAVAVASDGTVYVADTGNHKVRKITAAGVVTTLAGSGLTGGLDGTGTAASFNAPHGIAVAPDGSVQVADRTNNKIRLISTAGVVTTLAGTGSAGSADGSGLAATFSAPVSVTVGVDGTAYVADRGNHKVRRITVGALTNSVLAASVSTVTSGALVTLTATVTPQSPSPTLGTPTGWVSFKAGNTTVGTAKLNGSGVATLSVDSANLAEGVSSLRAIYQGRSGGTDPDLVTSTSSAVSLTVNRAPTLPAAVVTTTFSVGNAGSFQFASTGYPAPTFATASSLPAGVTLSTGGLLSGTPAAGSAGSYPITVTASNGIGGTVSRSFTLVVNSAPVFSGSTSLSTVSYSNLSARFTAVGYPVETNANLFTNDFSAATLPAGWTASGAASLTGGILELTPAQNTSRGIVTLPAVGAASPAGFSARFKLIVSNSGGADGLSFNYGALLTGAALDATSALETGMVSSGLVVTFGEYNDDRVEVRYNNQILSAVYVPLAASSGAAVEVTVTPLGLLTLAIDGATLTTVNLGADYVAAAKDTWQFAFAARTGASNSQHAIDDLAIDALQIAYGTTANLLDSTFGSALPAGWTLFGDASLDAANREVILTPNAASKAGALVLPALGAASPGAFSAQFDYRAADGLGADGTSFNYGVIPASPVGSETGIVTSGLVVQLIEFGTDTIVISYDGTTLASGNVNLTGPFRRVSIDVGADRAIAVSVNGVVAVSATLPSGYASANKSSWQFGFGARAGLITDKHSIRNLSIARPRGLPAGLALNPVTGLLSGTLVNPASADYAVTIVATNATGSTVRDVTIANRPLTTLSPTFAVPTDAGIIRSGFTETGVTLGTITLGFAPRPGQQLVLVQNTGNAASSGRFTGLAEGATVTASYNGDTFTFILSYVGGTGNDVTLTRVLASGQTEGTATVTTLAGSPANASGSADGTGVAASFNEPYGVAVGGDGTVYVADYRNKTIRRITPAGVVTTLAGSGVAGSTDATGVSASFNFPTGVAVGLDGTVYVADNSSNKVRKITPAGVVTTLAGSGSVGSADGTGAAATFNAPAGIAVDADGTVYVAESGSNKIRKITPAGVVTTLAGSGSAGSADGTGAAATFNNPTGIAVGLDGTVYVADNSSNKVRKITPAGVVTTLAGSGSSGSADGTGAAASFNAPSAVTVGTDGTVYVADYANNVVRRITAAGVVTTLAGAGSSGSTDGTGAVATFNNPVGVAVGLDGTVYVVDRANHKVRKIASADERPLVTSTPVTSITGTGATINGTVNPNGFITAAQVEYGPSADLGSTAPITLSPNNGTSAQTVSAALTGLTTGVTYYYRLKATNVDGTAVTTSGTFTPVAPVKPSLPTLTSTNVTTTAATWGGSVSSDGGAAITERGIKYRVAGSTGAYTTLTTSGTTGVFTVNVTGLTPATTYQFYAYAVNSAGEGRTSEEKSVTTLVPVTVPVAPTGLSATVGGTSAEVSFTPGANGGAQITNYEVSFDNGVNWVAMSPATTTSPLTLTGLTPGLTYQVKVRAVNSAGSGDASTAVPVAVPVTLAITSPASANGTYGTVFSYQVAGSGGPTSFSATGLPSGLSIDPGTGAISGTPTQTGTFTAELTIATTVASAKRALEIVIAKKALTVTAEAKSRGYGQDDPAFTATLSGFVGSDTAAVVTGSPKFTSAATAASPVGTYAITPSLGSLAATNYSFGTFTPADLTVTAQAATVVLGDLAQTYNGSTRPVKVTTSPAALAVTLSYVGTGTTSYDASSTPPTAAGTYAVTATISAANYSGTTTQTLVVAKASQTITIAPLPSSVALNTLSTVTISATASSGLAVSLSLAGDSAAGVGLNVSGGITSLTSLNGSTGTVKVNATQAGDANYDAAASASANFEVTKANQKITFTGPFDQAFNAASPSITLSASTDATGLAVSFTVVSGPATVSGSTLTLTGAGKVVVRASQAGDGTYNPAPDVDQSFTVGRSSQTVNFAALSNATYGDAPITLAATTTPLGRPVTYELISGPATLVGTTLTLTGAGDVSVRASQAGDADYDAATPVTRTFTVAPKALTVSGATAQAKTYDGTNAAVITGATLVGVVGADSVSLGGTSAGTFAQAGAGNALAVTTAMTLVGADAAKYTLTQPTGLTANISRKSLKVGGVTVADKAYDGLLTGTANYSAATFVGLIGSDSVTLDSSAATATFADKTAAVGKTVTIAGLALAAGGASANYTVEQPTATASILRKTLTVTGGTATSRAYNGTRTAAVSFSSASLSGKASGDNVDLVSSGVTASFDDRKVGVARPVEVTGLTLTGTDSANYNLGQPTLSASITPKALTVNGVTASDKVFDQLTTATIVTGSAVLVGVETADLSAVTLDATAVAGEFATAAVGTNKQVTILGLTVSGAEAANYTVTQPSATASITAAALTVSGIVGNNRAYDRTTTATVVTTQAALVGVLAGSGVTLDTTNLTASFATPGVGSNKIVQVTGLALSGPHAANYTLTQPTTTASISRAALTVTGVTVDNKVYDGTLTATAHYTGLQLNGIVNGDTVTPDTSGASAAFADKVVANAVAVAVTGITLSGGDAGNYSVTQPTLSANITAKPLTVSGITVSDRIYDGSALMSPSYVDAILVGVVSGDTVDLSTASAFATMSNAAIGTNKPVTFSGLSISGASASNYTLTQPSGTVSISAKDLSVTGVTASSKVYDGTRTATANFSAAALVGVIPGETVRIVSSGVTATFASATAETGKTVTISGLTLGGADAGNYTVTQPTATADITPKSLTTTGITAENRMFDATTGATINTSGATLVGVVGTDVVTLDKSAATGAFNDVAVGTNKAVQILNLGLSGADAANYSVVTPTVTADITAKGVTVVGVVAMDRPYDGTTVAQLDLDKLTLDGVATGDAITLVTTDATATFASKAVGMNKVVQVAGLTLSGPNAASYTLTQPTTTASITPAFLKVLGVLVDNKVYDGNTTAGVNFAYAVLEGGLDGDTVTLDSQAGTATFSSKTAEPGKTVTIAGLALSGADALNYTVRQPTKLATITPKNLTVAGVTAGNKVYDRTLAATPGFMAASLVGVVSGDAVLPDTTAATAAFFSYTVGTGKPVAISGLVLSGADAANYTVTQPSTSADIIAKPLVVIGAAASAKTYDGSRVATLLLSNAALAGVISPDAVTLQSGSATGSFADANAGLGKTVAIAGLALGGADAFNYRLVVPSVVADIRPAEVVIGITNLAQTYDGRPKPAVVTVSPAAAISITYGASASVNPPTNAGSYAVAVAVTDPNYAGSATATLVIAKAAQVVTLDVPSTGSLGTPVEVKARAGSGLPVTLAVSGPATLLGGQLVLTAPGTATVTATQAGNENYAPATATATVTSTGKLAQSITFGRPADRLGDSGAFALSAVASSGLPVSFTIVSGPALLAGSTVTLTGVAGTVQIRASQAGDSTYNPAPDVILSFNVTAVTTAVYFGTVTSAGNTAKAGDVAAALPPNSNRGSLLVVAPGVGINAAFEFTLNPDGTFTITYEVPSQPAATPEGTPATAAAPTTLTIRGSLVNGRLQGVIEPLGLGFNAAVLPVTGVSANAAGFYQSSSLATASGTTYSVVGTNNEVLVLATTPQVTTGGLTTLGADGRFSLQAQTGAGAATIRGAVDAPTTSVSGTISLPGQPETSFAGVASTTTRTDRLINLSSRVQVGAGRTLITGFVVGGTASKRVLLRAVGPALTGFGVTGALANPSLQLFDAAGRVVAENDDWTGADTAAAMAQVGAFGLAPGAQDAALLATLAPGAYTMQVTEASGSGVALAEIYDASPNPNADYQRLVNISTRGEAGIGENVLIGGFIISGNAPKKVLVRGIGPGLAAFGVAGTLTDPRLSVYRGSELVAENDNWSTGPVDASVVAQAARDTGAFALANGSKDAAVLLTLMPGAYTAQVSPADGTSTGIALIEIYELP